MKLYSKSIYSLNTRISNPNTVQLENFVTCLTKKFTFGEIKLNIVGSAKLSLLKPLSDIDMVIEVKNWQKSFLLAGYQEMGENSVRAKRREGNDPRWDRAITKERVNCIL